VDILGHKKRALLAKDKVSNMRLTTRDAIESDHKRNYERFKRRNREKKA
jgi:hypothetical protein